MTLAEIARALADKQFSAEELTRTLLGQTSGSWIPSNSFISITDDPAGPPRPRQPTNGAPTARTRALLGAPIAQQFSAEELTRTLLGRIRQLDPQLNSFISITDDLAIAQAKAADERRANGENGALLGAPIAHKDLFCTQGVRTSCGSKMLDNFVSPYDATVVEKLTAAGAVTLGKLNMDEFAMGSSNQSSHYGAVKNPWSLDRVPGGSSGGSAAAVAALLPAATGTDTGGSIRQPAALTNLTGIKPTYGRVSRWGMIAYASSLDQGGPLARTAEDCALMLG